MARRRRNTRGRAGTTVTDDQGTGLKWQRDMGTAVAVGGAVVAFNQLCTAVQMQWADCQARERMLSMTAAHLRLENEVQRSAIFQEGKMSSLEGSNKKILDILEARPPRR